VESLANAVRIARDAGRIGTAYLALGDCGETPSLTAEQVDDLRALVGDTFSLDYTVFGANLGHGGGHNRLAEGLAEDLLLIINPDAVAEPLLVARLAERLADTRVGIAEARQLPVEHPKEYHPDTGETPWASMACALLRADAVRQVGLFDADTFFMHGDDVDLSWRMRLAGWKIAHQPTARVFHDKAIGTEGYIEANAVERVHGPLASLLLAYKYSRDDEVNALIGLLRQGSPEQREALRIYAERSDAGRLPSPRLDRKGHVAEFVMGNFARHRF
jgi:GT2 family glycosyltransferase